MASLVSKGANLWQTSGSEIICQEKLHVDFIWTS